LVPGETSIPGGNGGPAPARVAGFVVTEEIGRGGMGIVYRGLDPKLGREVALKRPKPEYMARHDFASRFLREARTASRLMHPNVTTVFAAFEEDGVPWLAMELVEGGSLRERLQDGQPLSTSEVITHAEGLTDALRVAHENGILHADINPNNILLGRDGRARLTDFGLARARNAPGDVPVFDAADIPTWSSPDVAGTRGYMAPEHVRTGRIDERSDIFCLGLVLSEMSTGRSVFAGQRTVEWIGAVVDGEAQQRARPGADAPPELARIIARATATKPKDRYQSAAEMLEDVRSLRRYSESGIEMAIADAAKARKRTLYGILAAVGAVAVAGVIALAVWSSKEPPVLRPRPLTSAPGWEAAPAFSPDDRLIAYSSNEAGSADIWITDSATGESSRVTSDSGDELDPTWFPDGDTLAYVAAGSSPPSIWRVARAGGAPTLLVPSGEDPAVSPDGTQVAFATRNAAGELRIAVAPVDGRSETKLVTGDDDGLWDHRRPAWSPDGSRLCYADRAHLWIVDVAGGGARRLTSDPAGNRDPAWSADGRSIYFSSVREGPQALWRVAAEGGEPQRLTQGTGPEGEPAISHDGTRLAYATRREDHDIEVRDRARGRSWRIASSASDIQPALDPPGRRLAFVSNRLGTWDLWLQSLGPEGPQGPARRLTELPGTVAVPAFLPDGRWIAFHRTLDGERDIWLIPTDGGSPVNLTDTSGTDVHPAFSPDGTRLAFISARAGSEHVFVAAFAGGRLTGTPRQVTFGDGTDAKPSWSPDGRRLVFRRTSGNEADAWVVEVDSSTPPRRLTFGARVGGVRWGSDSDQVFILGDWGKAESELRLVGVADGTSEPFDPPVQLPAKGTYAEFDSSGDGAILALSVATVTGDVWVAEGLAGRQ
jgi:Tol biopolymer transport system component